MQFLWLALHMLFTLHMIWERSNHGSMRESRLCLSFLVHPNAQLCLFACVSRCNAWVSDEQPMKKHERIRYTSTAGLASKAPGLLLLMWLIALWRSAAFLQAKHATQRISFDLPKRRVWMCREAAVPFEAQPVAPRKCESRSLAARRSPRALRRPPAARNDARGKGGAS